MLVCVSKKNRSKEMERKGGWGGGWQVAMEDGKKKYIARRVTTHSKI